MQEDFFQKVKNDISAERLDAYGKQDHPDPCTLLARYLWNMAVCESLYAPLQFFEVALRNQINTQLIKKYGPEWYDDAPLSALQEKDVLSAKGRLSANGKFIHAGAVVAELSFGFWTAFFNKGNERLGLSYVAAKGFRKAPKSERNIKSLSRRLNQIRRLRNRVFHHERIIHWRDLPQQHQQILQSVEWLSPGLQAMAVALDRFSHIHTEGIEPWKSKIRSHWPSDLPETDAGGKTVRPEDMN